MPAKNIILLFCIISINLSAQIKYDPLYPPNSYRSSENPNYWKNKLPYPGYWQQDVYYEIDAEINEETVPGQEEQKTSKKQKKNVKLDIK